MSQHRPPAIISTDPTRERESEANSVWRGSGQDLDAPNRSRHRTQDTFSPATPSTLDTPFSPVTPFNPFDTPNPLPSFFSPSKDSPYFLAPGFAHSLDNERLDDTQYSEVLSLKETIPSRRRSNLQLDVDPGPLLPRSSSAQAGTRKKLQPLWHQFKQSRYWIMVAHTAMCIIGFPIVYFLPKAIGDGLSLFWARVVVGGICSLVGLSLGVTLLYFGRRGMEAAVWATVAHAATSATGGLSLEEVGSQVDPGPLSALILLVRRCRSDTRVGARHDPTYWSLVILLFLIVSLLAASSTFLLGRTVDIGVWDRRQTVHYSEVTVAGEHSTDDIKRAAELALVYEDFSQTWTLGTFSSSNQLPAPIQLVGYNLKTLRNESVYFSETFPDQLEGGVGFGTFDANPTNTTVDKRVMDDSSEARGPVQKGRADGGRVVRWPRWGIRIECARIPDLERNVILSRNSMILYTLIPRSVLLPLFESLGTDWPDILDAPIDEATLWKSENPPGQRPAEVSPDLNLSQIVGYASGAFWDTGLGHSFKSAPLTMGMDGDPGWRQIETALVRHNTSLCRQASFGRVIEGVVNSGPEGGTFDMGVDVGVCLETFEPYIVEAYTRPDVKPVTTAIVGKGGSFEAAGMVSHGKKVGSSLEAIDFSPALSSSGKAELWEVVHDSSRNIFLKDNGRDNRYAPSPSSVSFTDGHGPEGYTYLNGSALARSFAIQDSTHILPYLAGSQPLLARSYADVTSATVHTSEKYLSIVLFMVWAFGMVAALYVPKPPFGGSRRDFTPVSWLVALGLGEYENREAELVRKARRRGALKQMTLKELEERIGDLKVR